MNLARRLFLGLSLVLAIPAGAANWPQWRGPNFNGSTDEQQLPDNWSKTNQTAWSLDLPGPSAATPAIWGDGVFVSSSDKSAQTLVALGLDRKSGKILWQHKIADAYQQDTRSNYASPSPVTDGQQVVFLYGNGDLAAFAVDGKKLWQRSIPADYGDLAYQWTYGASPTLFGGKLYVQVLQRNEPVHGKGKPGGESYLLALDPATGKTLWQQVRPSDAVAESREAFTTPIPFEFKGRKELLIVGGDCLTGHDPETGKELWRWGTWNPTKIGHWRLVPSAVAGDGVILACAPKREPIFAVNAGGSGTLTDAALAWTSKDQRELSSDVPTPLFYLGDFFVLSDVRKSISRVEPKTGKVKWSAELPGFAKFEASPTGADGKIYLINFKGEVVIVDANQGKIIRTIPMAEQGEDLIRSSVAVSQGQLFIRTNQKLYCVGKGRVAAATVQESPGQRRGRSAP